MSRKWIQRFKELWYVPQEVEDDKGEKCFPENSVASIVKTEFTLTHEKK